METLTGKVEEECEADVEIEENVEEENELDAAVERGEAAVFVLRGGVLRWKKNRYR